MTKLPPFVFESAPELPGDERVSKYGLMAIRSLIDRFWNVEIEGLENVPLDGPAIIAPNHLSFCDSVFVPAALPRRAWAIGKGEYMDDWKTKHLFPAFGMIPVDRSGGDAAAEALDTAAKVLRGGHLFMIYPEGTRSRSEFLHKGRTGAARLAIQCDVPIIPVGHSGTLEVQKPDTVMMKRGVTVRVGFGEPLRAGDFGDPDDPLVARLLTDAVMFNIGRLSGQTYVNRYASSADRPGQVADDAPKIPKPPGRKATDSSAATGPNDVDLRPQQAKIAVPSGRKSKAASNG